MRLKFIAGKLIAGKLRANEQQEVWDMLLGEKGTFDIGIGFINREYGGQRLATHACFVPFDPWLQDLNTVLHMSEALGDGRAFHVKTIHGSELMFEVMNKAEGVQ